MGGDSLKTLGWNIISDSYTKCINKMESYIVFMSGWLKVFKWIGESTILKIKCC